MPPEETRVVFKAKASLPSRFGEFSIHGFLETPSGKEHTAIVRGDVADRQDCPLRIHSECHTGDVMGSLRCDCRDQLEASLRYIAALPFGAVVYLRQEGRDIGLVNKIRAYSLQDIGMDTVEANVELGFAEDARNYEVAAAIIEQLGIKTVALMTNNPDKIEQIEGCGIRVVRRIPVVIDATPHSERYLQTKKERMRHLF